MKKSLIILGSSLLFVAATVAQEGGSEPMKSKNGHTILPESGDWAIGIDASPFFRYAGNMFNNNSSNQAPTWNGYTDNPFILLGKYFADDNTAYRAIFAVTRDSDYRTNKVLKAMPQPTPNQFFTDSLNWATDSRRAVGGGRFVVGGGLEKRRGHGRLQGFYGGEALFSFEGRSARYYEYGNALTQNTDVFNPDVDPNDGTYTTNWGDNIRNGNLQDQVMSSGRLLESKTGTTFGFGVRAFIGAEYFIFPKISLGGEFGWGLGLSSKQLEVQLTLLKQNWWY
jgi:hypothetical protein